MKIICEIKHAAGIIPEQDLAKLFKARLESLCETFEAKGIAYRCTAWLEVEEESDTNSTEGTINGSLAESFVFKNTNPPSQFRKTSPL